MIILHTLVLWLAVGCFTIKAFGGLKEVGIDLWCLGWALVVLSFLI